MKFFSSFSCALALLAILNIANAKSMCTPMDPKKKEMYEEVYDTEFMGCTLTASESMTAMGRLHWLTPEDGHPLVEMDSDEMEDMSKMKGGSMAMAGVKVAAVSVGRPGYLTVEPDCVASLDPDFVYSCLAKSPSPKVFNAELEKACETYSARNINTTMRASEDTAAVAETLICIIGALLGLFFPFFDAALLTFLKTTVETAFDILPCPSMTARIIETVARA